MITLRLAALELRNKKGMAFTLAFLVFLAVLSLNTGLKLQNELQEFYEKRSEDLQSPDFFFVTENTMYQRLFENFVVSDKRVDHVEKEDVIFMESTKNNCNNLQFGAVFFNKDQKRQLAPLELCSEKAEVAEEDAIYLPLPLKNNGVHLGDEYILTYRNVDYPFIVAGFFETTYMGNTNTGFTKYFVSNKRFEELYRQTSAGKFVSIKLKEGQNSIDDSDAFKADFLDATNFFVECGNSALVSTTCQSAKDMKYSIQSLMSFPSVILIAIAIIICICVTIIVSNKVIDEINEKMPIIGNLQAMGYTTRQIRTFLTEEFLLTGLAGTLAGTIVTYVTLRFPMQSSGEIGGLILKPEWYPSTDLISAVIILVIIWLSAFYGTRTLKSLQPVVALRKGTENHSFRKNHFALAKGHTGVITRLALKNVTADYRSGIATAIVIAMCIFLVNVTVIIYYNFSVDHSVVVGMTGMEVADVQIKTMPHSDIEGFQKELNAMDGVRKTNLEETTIVRVEGMDTQLVVSDHLENFEVLRPTKGDLPKYENEIVLSGTLLKQLHKEIGDEVSIYASGRKENYIVSGSSMTTNMEGRMGIISIDGLRRIDPSHEISQVDIYLNEGISSEKFIDEVYQKFAVASADDISPDEYITDSNQKYEKAVKKANALIVKMLENYGVTKVDYAVMLDGQLIMKGDSSAYKIKKITDMKAYLDGQLGSFAGMMNGVITSIFLVTILVVGAFISITIKSLIRKKHQEFGIYKAIGYTTKDIVSIISIMLTVTALLGVTVGYIVSALTAGNLIMLFFDNIGLNIGKFKVNPLLLCGVSLIYVVFVWGLSIFMAYRVKKINAYELLTE